MGLFGFGKKKTTAEILAEGKALYERGDYGQAVILFLKVGRKENSEGDYWAGRGYLARFDQSGRDGDLKAAKRHLSLAAEAGHAGAADLLARRFGTGSESAPASAAPAPVQETPEAIYKKGRKAYALGNRADALSLFQKAAEQGYGKATLQCVEMYRKGEGVEKDLLLALNWAEKAKAQNVPGAVDIHRNILMEFTLEGRGGKKPGVKITSPAPAPKTEAPKPSPAPELPKPAPAVSRPFPAPKPAPAEMDGPQPGDEDYRKGEELRRAKDYDGVVAAWTKAAEQGHWEALKKLTGFYAGELTVWGFRSKESRGKYVDYDKAIQWGTAAMERGVDTAASVMDAYKGKGRMEEAVTFGENAASQGFDAEWKLMYLCIDLGRYEDAVAWGQKYDEKKGKDEAKKRLAQIRDEAFDKGVAADKEKNYSQALVLWERAAGLGSTSAMFNCGLMYDGGEGTAADKTKALMWYEKAAQQGHAKAQFHSGLMYDYGDGTAIDKAKALAWYEKAAEQGHVKAQFNCGFKYHSGEGTVMDSARALMWYKKAAEQGLPHAQYACGIMYDNGEGIATDKSKALIWYEKAAEQDFAQAQFACGQMYEKGIGTKADDAKAIAWYQKAAQQGNEDAESRLEYLLTPIKAEQGDAKAQYQYARRLEWSDEKSAFEFYTKSAEQGYMDAQYQLGLLYIFGEDIAKDSKKALVWFQSAARQGHKKAAILQNLINKRGASNIETELSKLIDRYENISDEEKYILIELYQKFPDDMKDKFNHAQAESIRKLASRL